jgi:outer membrane protein OmpA-like peptidoglycan-associated protein
MNKRQFLTLFLVVALLLVFISGCAGMQRIDSFFANGEYREHSKMIDFGLFFVIFFALCYISLTSIWGKGFGKPGEAKGSIVALSIALALTFAFAIISQTTFSITTLFPLAKAIFFLVVFILLYGMIVKTEIFGKHWGGKAAAFILAAILTYLLACIFTHMVCQMSDNMDDPACQSDFFNAFFNIAGRLFGVDEWTWGSSGGWVSSGSGRGFFTGSPGGWSWGGGEDYPTSYETPPQPRPPGGIGCINDDGVCPAGCSQAQDSDCRPKEEEEEEEEEVPEGPVKGGCRLDITFAVNEHASLTSGAPIDEYVKRAKAVSGKVNVYGFASEEGPEYRNNWLAKNRAVHVANLLKKAGLKASPKRQSERTLFGKGEANRAKNRRVVITTESLSGKAFLPAPGPGSLTPDCPSEAEAAAALGEEGEGLFGDGWNWLYLLPLIGLLLLFLGRKKVGSWLAAGAIDYTPFLAMKKEFVRNLEKIAKKKEDLWHEIVTFDATNVTTKHVTDKASDYIELMDKELVEVKKWKPLEQLVQDYQEHIKKGKLELIRKNAQKFGFDEKDADLIAKILKKAHDEHEHIANPWDECLKKAVTELVHDNNVLNECRKFTHLQRDLKKLVKEFLDKEEKLLKKIPEKRDPMLTKVVGIVRDLCKELMEKIDEVIDHIEDVKHHAGTWEELSKPDDDQLDFAEKGKYTQEKILIDKLKQEIEVQKNLMAEEWWPIIDYVHPQQGVMDGHIHYRQYEQGPAPGRGDFTYQWWLFDEKAQFTRVEDSRLNPATIRGHGLGIKLDGPQGENSFGNPIGAKNLPRAREGQENFSDIDPIISQPTSAGKIVALGACKRPETEDGKWKWTKFELPGTITPPPQPPPTTPQPPTTTTPTPPGTPPTTPPVTPPPVTQPPAPEVLGPATPDNTLVIPMLNALPHPQHNGSSKDIEFKMGTHMTNIDTKDTEFVLVKGDGVMKIGWVCWIVRNSDGYLMNPNDFNLQVKIKSKKYAYSGVDENFGYKYHFMKTQKSPSSPYTQHKINFTPYISIPSVPQLAGAELEEGIRSVTTQAGGPAPAVRDTPGQYSIFIKIIEWPGGTRQSEKIPLHEKNIKIIDENVISFKVTQ